MRLETSGAMMYQQGAYVGNGLLELTGYYRENYGEYPASQRGRNEDSAHLAQARQAAYGRGKFYISTTHPACKIEHEED
jgi:hypothetical protein